VPDLVVPKRFRKRLWKKTPAMQASILETVQRLGEDPRHPGLHTHKVKGQKGVFEAYVDGGNRVTFQYGDNCIVLRNHCNHDIIDRAP